MYRSPQALLLGLLLGLWPMGELVLGAGPGLAQGVERSVEQRKIEADRLRLSNPEGFLFPNQVLATCFEVLERKRT